MTGSTSLYAVYVETRGGPIGGQNAQSVLRTPPGFPGGFFSGLTAS